MTAVVTIAHGRHRHLRRQHASLAAGTLPDLYVVVAMDDRALEGWTTAAEPRLVWSVGPQDPRGLPLAASRNLGFRTALELGADVVVGLDVDCLVGAATVGAYRDVVRERPDVLWSGPTTYLPETAATVTRPTSMHSTTRTRPGRPRPGTRWVGGSPDHFWSLSFAVHAAAWAAVGGFCERYAGYGAEDTDLAHAWQHSGRASAGSATRVPTTSTTPPRTLRCSTSTTSCATGRSSPSAGDAGRWGAGSRSSRSRARRAAPRRLGAAPREEAMR